MADKLENSAGMSGIRVLVAAVDRDISRLEAASDHRQAWQALTQSWSALVGWLALGPAPQTVPCPRCGKLGMLGATLCGYCWTPLRGSS